MDFFGIQDQAQRSTRKLLVLFSLAVAAIIVALYLAMVHFFIPPQGLDGPAEFQVIKFFNNVNWKPPQGMSLQDWLLFRDWWYPRLFLSISIVIGALVLGGTLYKTSQLSKGGRIIATMLGGRVLLPDIADANERKLLNVVEEMAIASGTPVPTVYILEQEPGINAFAAGFSQKDMVIGVTKGCLALLSRDELQGVIAHEFSHILRGDMRLNMRLMGTVFGITMISMIGYFILRFTTTGFRVGGSGRYSGKGKRKGGGGLGAGIVIIGIVLYVFGYIGVFFGNLIKSAIARQREFLADASAVQFTRNPAGLAGALKKIGGLTQGSRILSPHAHEASHFYFSTGIKNGFFNMLATHPPLKQRILRLDPSFDGVYPKIEATGLRDDPKPASGPLPDSAGKNFPLSNVAGGSIDPQRFVANIGILTADQIDYAAGLRKELPEKLLEAVREPAGASATVLALLLGHDQSIRNIQLELLRKEAPAAVFDEISKLSDLVRILKPESRIPVVDWAMPALRNLSDNQYNQFRALASALISADRQVDLFEFCIDKMIRSHLDAHFHGPPSTSVKYFRTEDILPEAVSLLTALAWTGQSTMEEASRAFRTGFVQLNLTQKRDTTLAAKEESLDLERMDFTLEKLSRAGPYVKKNLLFACAHTVSSDGKVMDSERELLRAIADSFDLPVPPFVHEMVH